MEQTSRVMPTHIIAAAGVVLNERQEVLLVKHNHAGWVFPGGQVEVGETVMDAVKREVMEETGVSIEVGELFCAASNVAKHPGYNGVKEVPTKLMLDFICTATGGTPRPSEENAESRFIPKEQVLEMITAPNIIERYKAYLEYTGRPIYMAYTTQPVFKLNAKRFI